MALFGLEYTDGKQYELGHPCFAWVGTPACDGRNENHKAEDRVAVFFHCNSGMNSAEDTKFLFDALIVSPMADKVKYVYCDGSGSAEGSFKKWTFPHIRMEVSVELPAWEYFRLIKLSAKHASYGLVATPQALITALKEGGTFAEAIILSKVNSEISYNYPYLDLTEDKTEFLGFVRDNELPDLSKHASERHNKPFREYNTFSASSPDTPYGWGRTRYTGIYDKARNTDKDHLITAKTIKELRETYEYFPKIKE